MSTTEFNYKFIKDNASAGSWRRGYEYHLKDMVFDNFPEKNFYKAKVKGNFQDHYNTDLIFKKNKVEARCNCPLKEEWCKHAVAVALNAIDEHAYEDWLETKFGMEFDFPDENGKPYRTSGGEMVWNEQLKREIPKGWEATNIGNLTTVVTGKEDANFSSPNGKYKFFTCSQEALLCDTPAFSGQAVLIAGNGDFNVKHYSGEFNAYQRTYVLIPENQVYYGAMYISSKNQIQAFKNGSNGSIVKFITKGDVENIPFILPNDDSIFHQINKLIEKIELCERENEELTKLRDWLLPMLMNGQARVE